MMLTCWGVLLFGCKSSKSEPPFWEQIKLKDLAPPPSDSSVLAQRLRGMTIDIYQYEVPLDKFNQINALWNPLNQQALRFKNQSSFTGNGFRIGRGSLQQWDWIIGMLDRAQAQKVQVISMLLTEEYDQDVMIRPIPGRQAVSFLDPENKSQSLVIGAGYLTFHVKAEKPPSSPYPTHITGYPLFSVPTTTSIEPLARRANDRQIAFQGTAFTARMMPGEILVLGPDEFYGDESTLGGLFFRNPAGRRFGPSEEYLTPEIKPTVRVFVIMCTQVQ